MTTDYLLIAHDIDRPSILHMSHHISLKKARQEAKRKLSWEDKKIYKFFEVFKEDKK